MSTGKVVLGLLAGIATGAVLGILFAPEKGSVTRKKIAKKGEDYVDDLKEKFDDFKDGISEKFEKVKEDVSEFAHHYKNAAEKEAKSEKAYKTT
ncbi:MAG: YtxH domain-containing protein [Bacteroidetes bacterium]|nr:YtxH domain-containing protein [Bacteroidota bacterium]